MSSLWSHRPGDDPVSGEPQQRVIPIDADKDPRWESFVNAHPESRIYHHPAWLRLIERAYGHQPAHLACEDREGRLVGVLPLFYVRGVLGRRFVSLPHTPVAGPIGRSTPAAQALLRAAVERARQNPGTRLELKVPEAQLDGCPNELAGLPWELTYVLHLPEPSKPLRFGSSRNHSRIMWAVHKAAKLGVRVRFADHVDDLQRWYELYLQTMRWHAVPPRPYAFFKTAWELLRPAALMRLLLAEQEVNGGKKLLAGSIVLSFGNTVVYAFNGRRQQDLALRPNDMIQWRAVSDAHREGFQRYDFGEVADDNAGLAEFKSKWGAEPQRMYRYYYPPLAAPSRILQPQGVIRQIANSVWRRLPLKTTGVLGAWLYRRL